MKPLRCVLTPAADQDIDAIAGYYAQESGEELVVRFLLALDKVSGLTRECCGSFAFSIEGATSRTS